MKNSGHAEASAGCAKFDAGDRDCGNDRLLPIRKPIDPMHPGQLLEMGSTQISVDEDFARWAA